MVRTIEQAHLLVKKLKVCTLFPSNKVAYSSLWENVDLPDKQPGETGWGEKMSAVWSWKNRLPADYPNDIFYGKIEGGLAVLMDMAYLSETHFREAYVPVRRLNRVAQYTNDKISEDLWTTTALRKAVIEELGCTKSQFDTALKNLQITMNIVRLNDPQAEQDTWVPFKELYLEIWQRYVED